LSQILAYGLPSIISILLYPSTGTGAVNVTNGDLKRLEPGEFLNDTLIELGLKLVFLDVCLFDSNIVTGFGSMTCGFNDQNLPIKCMSSARSSIRN
jgi:hypothetical protein